MKKIFTFFSIAAAAVMSLASCQNKELAPEQESSDVHFVMNASIAQTKTFLVDLGDGKYKAIWDDPYDYIMTCLVDDNFESQSYITMHATASDDASTATFEGNSRVPDVSSQKFVAYYPYNAASLDDEGSKVFLQVKKNQLAKYLPEYRCYSFGRETDILVSKPGVFNIESGVGRVDNVQFTRVCTVLKLNFNCASDKEYYGDVITNVVVSTPNVPISGQIVVDMATSEVVRVASYGEGTDKLNLEVLDIIGTKVGAIDSNCAFMTVAPVTIPSGTEMTITITTDKRVFEKKITTPEIVFPVGDIAVFNLNLTDADIQGAEQPATEMDVTWDLTKDETASASTAKLTWEEEDVVSMEFTKGTSTNANNYYPGTSGQTYNHTRIYTGATITVTPAEGVEITAVDFITTGATQLGTFANGVTWTDATTERDDDRYAVVVTPNSTTEPLVGKVSAACRLNGVVVHCLVGGTPVEKTVLATPTNLNVNNKTISWSPVENAGEYTVGVGSTVETVTTTSYVFTGKDDYYDVSVIAVPSDKTLYKSSQAATLSDAKLGTPRHDDPVLTLGTVTENSITVSWVASDKPCEYHTAIYDGMNPIDSKIVKEGNTVTFSGLASAKEYAVGVSVRDAAGVSKVYEHSDEVKISATTRAGAVHVSDVTAEGSYQINGLTVYAKVTNSTAIVGDGTGFMLVYKSNHGLEAGYTLDIDGEVVKYNGVWEYKGDFLNVDNTGATVNHGTPVAADAAYLAAYKDAPVIKYVHLAGNQTDGKNITVDGNALYMETSFTASAGKQIEADGYVYGYSTSHSNSYFVPVGDITVKGDIPAVEVEATIAEALAGDSQTVYVLTGKVKNIVSTVYGNFDLVDATGQIYIYGLLNAAGETKKFAEMGIDEDDTVVLKGQVSEYNGAKQIKNAQYISHTKAVKVPVKLNWTGYTDKYYVGETFKVDGTITVDFEDGTNKTLAATDVALVTSPDLSKAGTTSAVIKYENAGTAVTATASITVEAAPAGGTPEIIYTLDTTTAENGSNNSYTGTCDVTVGGITWNVMGNAQQHPWRIGGKSLTGADRTVYTKTAFAKALTKIDLTVGGASSITVNSLALVYSTNEDFSNAQTISKSFAANSTISFAADFPAGCYYKFVFNVSVSGTSNKFVEFKKVEFWGIK